MRNDMTKVLITGACGFIGNRLAKLFLDNGYDVVGWDRSNNIEPFIIYKVDMTDQMEVLSNLKECNPHIVIHCAGSADVGKSVENPEIDFIGNVTLTHNILFSMHRLKMENVRFVFLSSAGVYGNPSVLPITEDEVVNPLSPYAVHKVMCEDLCMYFVKNYGMDIKIARIFSAYGVGLRKQIFWDMYNKVKSSGMLTMFGTGNESRDYIHVDDVVNVLYLLSIKETKDIVFNVGNGEEIKIRTVAEYFADSFGINRDNIIFNGNVREGDPINWKADVKRIQKIGYVKSKNIDQGIKEYCDWVKSL